jgi:pyrroline-5-carboxylate reductase
MDAGKIAFIGGGNMGRALVAALRRDGVAAARIAVGETDAALRAALNREFGVAASADNGQVAAGAAVLVLAVKPQDMARVLQPLAAQLLRDRPVLLSIAAGLRTADLARWCGGAVPVVRAMPNRPALVGAGATAVYAAPDVTAPQRALAEAVLRPAGSVVWLDDESQLDAVTALSGSGPAYFFLLAEAMADAGIALGLPPPAARELAIATLHGSGVMAAQGDGDLARLRAEVTSRGGTTEAALRSFADSDLPGVVARAMRAAEQRSRELAASLSPTRN